MEKLKDLKTNEKLLILKAIIDNAQGAYNTQKEKLIDNIIINGKIQNDYGQFYTQTSTSELTVAEKIAKNKQKIKELQEENKELQTLDNNAIIQQLTYKLVAKPAPNAKDIATNILQDLLLETFDAKRLASKVAKSK